MRLYGDTACFVELAHASLLPETTDADQRPYLRDGEATVTCAAGTWKVLAWGGSRQRLLLAGDRVVASGVNTATGERFTVPVVLACVEPGWAARFAPAPAPRARGRQAA
jgi:hypothetical protein